MKSPFPPAGPGLLPRVRPQASLLAAVLCGACAVLPAAARAASPAAPAASAADKRAPLTYEADSGKADLIKKLYTLKGHVRIQQGNLTILAEDAQVRQGEGGRPVVLVTGSAGDLARFEQKQAAPNEVLKGQALTIDYDDRSAIVRLKGQAQMRRMQGETVIDEVVGSVITYNRTTGEFQVQGDNDAPGKPGNRVRGVLSAGGDGTQ